MTQAAFRVEPLDDTHDRVAFRCGEEILDRYFQTQVTQDVRRLVANCFVAVENATARIAGFYTLFAAGIPVVDLPDDVTKRLPRYPTLPAVRIGRLAVDLNFQGKGVGSALILSAVDRAAKSDVASCTLLVDAKSDEAVRFYERHGFRGLQNRPRSLFLPLATAQRTLKREASH